MVDLHINVDRERRTTRSLTIIQRYTLGHKITDIANDFGCSKRTVLRLARLAGLPKRPKCFPTEIREAVIRMLRAGDKYEYIARKCGVGHGYISGVAKAEGIPRYKGWKVKQ